MLQGPEGTQVVLTVKPAGGSSSKDVRITRQPIEFNPVDFALCSSSGEQGQPRGMGRECQTLGVCGCRWVWVQGAAD